MSGDFRITGISPGDIRLWCAAGQASLRERRARENELRRLWASGDSRPEWCLLAREGMVPLGALLLLREDREARTLLIDGLSLPWAGAWRGLGRRLLNTAIAAARDCGATALVWQLPAGQAPDPAPLALDLGFLAEEPRTRFLLLPECPPSVGEGWRAGWHEGLTARLETVPPGQHDAWREGGDLLITQGTGENALLALCDGDGSAELLAPSGVSAGGGFAVLLSGLWRHGVRRIELEWAGSEPPSWFEAPGPGGEPVRARPLTVIRRFRLEVPARAEGSP